MIFHHQSQMWQNSGSRGTTKMLSANQIAGFFKMYYLKEEVNDVYFWYADKHRSLLQVNTIISVYVTRHSQRTQNKKFAYLCNITRKLWCMKLIFYLQINTKVFYKLIVWLWVWVARQAQEYREQQIYNIFAISQGKREG